MSVLSGAPSRETLPCQPSPRLGLDLDRSCIASLPRPSSCGLTDSNYKALAALKDGLAGSPFEILAFPCNQVSAKGDARTTYAESRPCQWGADLISPCPIASRKAPLDTPRPPPPFFCFCASS